MKRDTDIRNHIRPMIQIGAALAMFAGLTTTANAQPFDTELGMCYRAVMETCVGEFEENACVNTGLDRCDRDHAVSAVKLSVEEKATLRLITLKRELPAPSVTETAIAIEAAAQTR
ncbi:MAG: hypothetical protein AAF619_12080 [Pseudomonadota bacterium]